MVASKESSSFSSVVAFFRSHSDSRVMFLRSLYIVYRETVSQSKSIMSSIGTICPIC